MRQAGTTRERLVVLLVVLLLVLGAAACGGGPDGEIPAGGEAATVPRVLLAGDSVMGQLERGVDAALAGRADVGYVGTPYVAGNEAQRVEWADRLDQQPADLVVLMLGPWEAVAVGELPAGVDYAAAVRPFLEVLAERSEVLLLGAPEARVEPAFTTDDMNAVWRALADELDGVDYLDVGAAVEDQGEFRTLLDVEGRAVLVRQLDGRHLCPDGVVLATRALLPELALRFGVEPVAGWEEGAWRSAVPAGGTEWCPADLGEPLAR